MLHAQEVYGFLLRIPYGKVVTYGQIAKALGAPNAARAVGNFLHHNPDTEKYPCYKVVNAEGRLAPHFALGIEEQKRRLEQEGIPVVSQRVNLALFQWKEGR